MIKRLPILLLLLFLPQLCMAQVNVTGNLKDLGVNNITSQNTYVQFTLRGFGSQFPRVISTNVIVSAVAPPFRPDGSGNISGQIQPNDTISPSGTSYQVCIFNKGIQFACNVYTILQASGTFNLNSAVPEPPPCPTCGTQPPTPPPPGPGTCGIETQTNGVDNQTQCFLDNDDGSGAKAVSVVNTSGGHVSYNVKNTAPPNGTAVLLVTLTNILAGQNICFPDVNDAVNCTPGNPVYAQNVASYAVRGGVGLSSDRESVLTHSGSSAASWTIAQAGTTGFEAGFSFAIINFGSATITLTPTTSTISYGTTTAASSMPIAAGQSAIIYDDGVNYEAMLLGTLSISCAGMPALTGQVNSSSGSCATTVSRTCMMQFGSDGAAAALATTDYFPQMSDCYVKDGGTVNTVIVMADSGASTVRVGFDVNGSYTQISPTLTPATVSGIADKVACANTGGTAITIKGTSVTCSTLSSTSIAAGQYLEPSAGTADGTTKRLSIAVTWQ